MLVRNLPSGSYALPNGFKTWLDYWVSYSGKNKVKCAFLACMHEGTLGVLVEREDEPGVCYVIPECYSCSMFPTSLFYLVDPASLVKVADMVMPKDNDKQNSIGSTF